MTTRRTYKTYPRGCKEEAVTLVNEQGYSVQKAAVSLFGIRPSMGGVGACWDNAVSLTHYQWRYVAG